MLIGHFVFHFTVNKYHLVDSEAGDKLTNQRQLKFGLKWMVLVDSEAEDKDDQSASIKIAFKVSYWPIHLPLHHQQITSYSIGQFTFHFMMLLVDGEAEGELANRTL